MSPNISVSHFFECVNNRKLDELGDLLAAHAEFYFPKTQPLLGRDRIIRFFKILFRRYPELSFKVLRQITDGHKAAVHWTNQGIKKNGEPYNNEGVTLLEMESNRIRFISDFFKDTDF